MQGCFTWSPKKAIVNADADIAPKMSTAWWWVSLAAIGFLWMADLHKGRK